MRCKQEFKTFIYSLRTLLVINYVFSGDLSTTFYFTDSTHIKVSAGKHNKPHFLEGDTDLNVRRSNSGKILHRIIPSEVMGLRLFKPLNISIYLPFKSNFIKMQ